MRIGLSQQRKLDRLAYKFRSLVDQKSTQVAKTYSERLIYLISKDERKLLVEHIGRRLNQGCVQYWEVLELSGDHPIDEILAKANEEPEMLLHYKLFRTLIIIESVIKFGLSIDTAQQIYKDDPFRKEDEITNVEN